MDEYLLTPTQNLPKICVTVKRSPDMAVDPPIELRWCHGLEDAITRLSEKVLEESIVAMNIQKSGVDFHITYQLGDEEDDSSALALVKELREWH